MVLPFTVPKPLLENQPLLPPLLSEMMTTIDDNTDIVDLATFPEIFESRRPRKLNDGTRVCTWIRMATRMNPTVWVEGISICIWIAMPPTTTK